MEVCLYVIIMYFKNLIKIRKIRIIVIVKVWVNKKWGLGAWVRIMNYTGVWIQCHRVFILPFHRAFCCSRSAHCLQWKSLEEKARLVLFNPSFPLSQWIIWKTEKWQSFTTGGEGEKNQHPSNTPSSPWTPREKQGCSVLSDAGFPSPRLLPTCSSPSGSVRWDFREWCPWGVRCKAHTAGIKCPGAWRGDVSIKKRENKKEKARVCMHTNQ